MLKFNLILALIMLCFFNLCAQDLPDLNFTGNGARAAGMGYAFTGIADDATAISWNPAGLAQLYSAEASVVGRFGSGSIDFTGIDNPPVFDRSSSFQLNFASLVFPINMGNFRIVTGVAYRIVYDWNDELKINWKDWMVPSGLVETYTSEGGVAAITPSVGFEINDMVAVGTSFNIITGSNKTSFKDNNGSSDESEEESYSGLGIDIGVLIKPSEIISFGANLNLPHEVKYEAATYDDVIKVPFFYSIGAAAHATDQFTIAFDFQSRAWSNSETFEGVDFDVDLNSIHVGIEYLLQGGNIIVPIRAGYYNNPTFQWDYEDKQIVNNVFTFGAGLVMDNIIFDGACEIENQKLDYNDYTQDETNIRITVGGTVHFGD